MSDANKRPNVENKRSIGRIPIDAKTGKDARPKKRSNVEDQKKRPILILEECGCYQLGEELYYCFEHARDFNRRHYEKQIKQLRNIMNKTRKLNEHIVLSMPKNHIYDANYKGLKFK